MWETEGGGEKQGQRNTAGRLASMEEGCVKGECAELVLENETGKT